MYIIANNITYDTLIKLSFSPSTDMVGNKLPVNQFSADIRTTNDIPVAINAFLYDENNVLWAKYWITQSERIDAATIRIKAESTILLLNRFNMPDKYYNGVTVAAAVAEIFANIQSVFPGETIYTVDSSIASKTVTGFCKEQTARERLQWICFCAGGYVKTYFNTCAEIKLVDDTSIIIPEDKTFYKPTVGYGAYVTKVRVRAYTYTQGTPQTVDKWVTDGTNYYIQTTQDYSLSNPDVIASATENEVVVDKVTLINQSNAADILANLAKYYFKRIQLSADILDDGDFVPGDKCIVSTGDQLISGYLTQVSFSFGHSTRAKIKLEQSDEVASAILTIRCLYGLVLLLSRRYRLPVGYAYSISNQFIDKVLDDHRYIFRPNNASASGTLSADTVDDEPYSVALDWDDFVLYTVSVDSVSESNEVVSIG